jgi:hypothetical protein
MARGTEGHGNLAEQKKNKRPKARVFVPPAMGKKASAGGQNTSGKITKEIKEKNHSNLTRNFFLFFPRGIFTPSLGKKSPSWGYKYPSLGTFIFFCSARFP